MCVIDLLNLHQRSYRLHDTLKMTTRIGFHDLPLEVRQDIITRFVKDCIVEGFEGLNSSMTAQVSTCQASIAA